MSLPSSRQDHHVLASPNFIVNQPPYNHSSIYPSSNNAYAPLANDIKMEHPHNAVVYPQNLPKVGQTRCCKSHALPLLIDRCNPFIDLISSCLAFLCFFPADWALLNAQLQFVVLDPVLNYHLQEQAHLILSKTLLDFVHPDEQTSARNDLHAALEDERLHGSVTRRVDLFLLFIICSVLIRNSTVYSVRYSRLSRVRRLLGYDPTTSSPPYSPSFPADRIAIDANYMAVDVVINWVSDGLVLCFIHAVVDILPREDNDELRKTGWSNWCSTHGFDEDVSTTLFHFHCLAHPTHIP